MDKEYIKEIIIANTAANYPGIDVSAVRDYLEGRTPENRGGLCMITVRCLCTDCAYNKKARCAKPGGIMIQHYALGPMCEDFKEIYGSTMKRSIRSTMRTIRGDADHDG